MWIKKQGHPQLPVSCIRPHLWGCLGLCLCLLRLHCFSLQQCRVLHAGDAFTHQCMLLHLTITPHGFLVAVTHTFESQGILDPWIAMGSSLTAAYFEPPPCNTRPGMLWLHQRPGSVLMTGSWHTAVRSSLRCHTISIRDVIERQLLMPSPIDIQSVKAHCMHSCPASCC